MGPAQWCHFYYCPPQKLLPSFQDAYVCVCLCWWRCTMALCCVWVLKNVFRPGDRFACSAPLRAKAYPSGVRWMDYSPAGERGSGLKRGGCRPRFAHHYSPFSPCWYARLGYAVFPRSTFCSILCLVCNGPNPYRRRRRRRRQCLQRKGCVQRRGEKVGRWQMRKGDIECVCVCASVCEWWCLRRRWPPSRTTRRSRVADTNKHTHHARRDI